VFNIVLFEPEIPPNTGNIIRLCANTGAHLHLIEPIGFELDDKRLRRAGLDYAEWAQVTQYPDWQAYLRQKQSGQIYAITTRGKCRHTQIEYRPGDSLVFGPETRGLPQAILEDAGPEHCLRIPMLEHSRSLNLANSVAVVLYEAWRQQDFQSGS
jgi:tRNA (cytidine/uridine-2'-O-)-methyltransferase